MYLCLSSTRNLTNISRLTAHLHLRIDCICEPISSPTSKEEAQGTPQIPQKHQEVEQGAVIPCSSPQKQTTVPTVTTGKAFGNGHIPSEEEVLRLIAFQYFQEVDKSDPQQLNGFLRYLKEVRKVLVVDSHEGSLIITVQCSSLQILKELWEDYRTGHLNEIAQQFLVTEDILRAFGQIKVKLQTTIKDNEYMACKDYFIQQAGEWEGM